MTGAYHSSLTETNCREVCGFSLLPHRTDGKRSENIDIIDETFNLFKANVLFRNYEVKTGADRTLIYMTLFVSSCLAKCQNIKNKADAKKQLFQHAIQGFKVPGDNGFALGGFAKDPESRSESDSFRQYFTEARKECANRFCEVAFLEDGSQSKYWFCFSKKKFMNMTLN